MTQNNRIWIATLLLFSLSAYMTFVYSPELSKIYHYENSYIFFYKQLVSLFIGVLIIFGLSSLSVEKWFNKIGVVLLVISSLFVILLWIVPSSSASIEDVKFYLVVSGFSIAPMLFFVLGLVWLVSYFYERKKDFKVVVASVLSLLVIGIFYIVNAPYRLERVKTWLTPFSVVPTPETALHETLLLSILDTLGVFGLISMVAIFAFLLYTLVKKEYVQQRQKYFAIGVVILVSLDLLVNILYSFGFFLLVPTLYFVGYGSSVVMSTALMVGMLLMKDKKI